MSFFYRHVFPGVVFDLVGVVLKPGGWGCRPSIFRRHHRRARLILSQTKPRRTSQGRALILQCSDGCVDGEKGVTCLTDDPMGSLRRHEDRHRK